MGVGTDCDRRRRCARRRSLAGLARRRTGRLQQQFGPEYERTLGTTGSKRDAEAELQAREEGRQRLEIRPLSQAARDRYLQSRQSVQAQFVAGRTRCASDQLNRHPDRWALRPGDARKCRAVHPHAKQLALGRSVDGASGEGPSRRVNRSLYIAAARVRRVCRRPCPRPAQTVPAARTRGRVSRAVPSTS